MDFRIWVQISAIILGILVLPIAISTWKEELKKQKQRVLSQQEIEKRQAEQEKLEKSKLYKFMVFWRKVGVPIMAFIMFWLVLDYPVELFPEHLQWVIQLFRIPTLVLLTITFISLLPIFAKSPINPLADKDKSNVQ